MFRQHRHVRSLIAYWAALAALPLAALTLAGSATARPLRHANSHLTPVTFRLDFPPDGRYSPFYLGQQRGYFAKQGIDLQIIPGSGSADSVKFLGTGAVDFALVDPLVATAAKSQKVPIASVGIFVQRSPEVLISRASDPITTPTAMLGKKIGVARSAATFQGLQMIMKLHNIDASRVQLVETGFSVAPLLVNQVDGLMGYIFNQPLAIAAQGVQVHNMLLWNFGLKAYGLGIMVNDSLLQKPELIKGFLAATRESMEAVMKDPQAGVDAFVKANPTATPSLELARLKATIPFFTSAATKDHGLLWQTPQMWATTISTALQSGAIEPPAPSAAGLWTDKFLKNTAKQQRAHKPTTRKKHRKAHKK